MALLTPVEIAVICCTPRWTTLRQLLPIPRVDREGAALLTPVDIAVICCTPRWTTLRQLPGQDSYPARKSTVRRITENFENVGILTHRKNPVSPTDEEVYLVGGR
ncbi:hypothetical protein ACOMHN_018596 [Nucella lapillus]